MKKKKKKKKNKSKKQQQITSENKKESKCFLFIRFNEWYLFTISFINDRLQYVIVIFSTKISYNTIGFEWFYYQKDRLQTYDFFLLREQKNVLFFHSLTILKAIATDIVFLLFFVIFSYTHTLIYSRIQFFVLYKKLITDLSFFFGKFKKMSHLFTHFSTVYSIHTHTSVIITNTSMIL